VQETPSGSGSGSVIDNQGRILTNYHVIEGAQNLMVSLGGAQKYPARYVGGDPDTDLARYPNRAAGERLDRYSN
jgi:S1-C subfamily serine protease